MPPSKPSPAPPVPTRLQSGDVVGYRYSIEARVGRGGIGTVFLASDLHVGGRAVALKILREDRIDEERERGLRSEYELLSRLRHPHVEAVMDFGRDKSHGLFIAKEFLAGVDILRSTEGMRPERVLLLAMQLFRALAFLHTRRLIHNDIKPDNILVVTDPGSPSGQRAVLIDFGIASHYSHESTEQTPTGLVGTLGYLAPERIKGSPPDARTDLYAAGILLYRLLCRELPFDPKSEAAELLAFHLYKPTPRPSEKLPSIPEPMDDLVLKLLAKDPAERFQSAQEVLQRIGTILGQDEPMETVASREGYVRSVPLIGRDQDFQTITEAVLKTTQGKQAAMPAFFVIQGGPGMGKSRLLTEILVRARLQGALVLTGSGRKQGGGLGPLRSPLRRIMTEAELKRTMAFVENPDPEQRASRREVLRTLATLFVERGRHAVLAIEDLHNTDELTLDFLQQLGGLMRSSRRTTLACVCTTRPSRETGITQFLHQAFHDGIAAIHNLTPLPKEELKTFVAEAIGKEPPDSFVEVLDERTGGNPEAVQEGLKLLLASGVLSDATWGTSEGWHRCDTALPNGVIPILKARIALLSPEARKILKVLSIVTRPLPAPVVAQVGELPLSTTTYILTDLARRELLLARLAGRDLQYLIAHDRMAEAVKLDAGPKDLRRLHHSMMMAIESFCEESDWLVDLAYHAIRSGISARAARHALKAGAELEAVYAWDRASTLYEDLAVVQGLDPEILLTTHLRLGKIYEQTGEANKATSHLAVAARTAVHLDQKKDHALALKMAAGSASSHGLYRKALARATRALLLAEEAGDESLAAQLKLLLAQIHYEARRFETSKTLLTDARRALQELGDIRGLGRALNLRGRILWKQKRIDDAAHCFRQSFRISGQLAGLANQGACLLAMGRHQKAHQIFRKALAQAKREGRLRDRAIIEMSLGQLRLDQGYLCKARKLFVSSLEVFDALSERPTAAASLAGLVSLSRDQGGYAKATDLLSQARAKLKGLPQSPINAAVLRQLAMLSLFRGELDRAKRAAARAVRIDSRWEETSMLGSDHLLLAEIAIEEASREDYLTNVFDARSAFGTVDSRAGLLLTDLMLARGERTWGSQAEASKQLAECLKAAQQLGMRRAEVEAQVAIGGLTLETGLTGEALELTEEPLQYVREEEAKSLEARIRLLRARIWVREGDLAQASAEVNGCDALVSDPRNVLLVFDALSSRAMLLLAASREREALAQTASIAQRVRALGLRRLTVAADHLLARAAETAGRQDIAEKATERVNAATAELGIKLSGAFL